MKPAHEKLAVAFFLFVFVSLAVTSALTKSATVEEFVQIPAGLYTWKTNDFSLYEKVPPIGRMFATAPVRLLGAQIDTDLEGYPQTSFRPWLYATDFMWNNIDKYRWILLVSRLTVMVFGVLLCLVVWKIAREGFGEWGGLLALASCALSPTLIALSRLVTPDVIAALFSIIFFIMLIEYFEEPRSTAALKMAAALGIAIGADFSCLVWIPFALAAPFLASLTYITERFKRPGPFRTALHILSVIVLTWLVIICCYFGRNVGFHRDIQLESRAMKTAAPLARVIPLPKHFILGLDKNLHDAQPDEWSKGFYLFGEWHEGAKRDYLALAVAFKEPVPHLVLFLLTALMIAASRHRDRDETILLVAIVIFFAVESLLGPSKDGIRCLLPVYPAAFILIGRLAGIAFEPFATLPNRPDWKPVPIKTWRKVVRVAQKVLLGLFALWMFFQHALIWPHYIPYFNLAAQHLDNREALLLDSNLDWGQDLPGLARWMDKNEVSGIDLAYFGHDAPGRFKINYSLPARGSDNQLIAISANFLTGKKYPMTFLDWEIDQDDPLWPEIERYRNETPLAVIGHSIFVFNKLH